MHHVDCFYFKYRAMNLKGDPEFCSAILVHFPGPLTLHSSVRFSHLFLSHTLNTSPVAFPFGWHHCLLLYWESWSVQRSTSSDSSTILTSLPTPVAKSSGSDWYMNCPCPWFSPSTGALDLGSSHTKPLLYSFCPSLILLGFPCLYHYFQQYTGMMILPHLKKS